MKKVIAGICFLFLPAALQAASWAVLPAGSGSLPLSFDRDKTEFETTSLMILFLKTTGMRNVAPLTEVKSAIQSLDNPRHLSERNLRDIARLTDSDRLLIPSIEYRNRVYNLKSSVYYLSSGQNTDILTTQSSNLKSAVSEHLRARFSRLKEFSFSEEVSSDILFLLDSSGRNYREIRSLNKGLSSVEFRRAAVCTGGRKSVSFLKPTDSRLRLSRFLNSLRTAELSYSQILKCGIRLSGSLKDPSIIMLVPELHSRSYEYRTVKMLSRRLNRRGRLLIFAGGSLSRDARDFWRTVGAENGRAYRDILYRRNIGLADASSWYLFSEGSRLIESRNNYPDSSDNRIAVPAHRRSSYSYTKMIDFYSDLSGNRVISEGSLDILLPEQIARNSGYSSTDPKTGGSFRVLLISEGIPVWVSIPARLSNELRESETVTLMLNLLKPTAAERFRNSADSVMLIRDTSNLPKSLKVEPADFMKSPSRYLNKSFDRTSLYLITGTIKKIRLKGSY